MKVTLPRQGDQDLARLRSGGADHKAGCMGEKADTYRVSTLRNDALLFNVYLTTEIFDE
jgi:hypothetical protein